jgi:DNA-binding cell septation regulator SpoVG
MNRPNIEVEVRLVQHGKLRAFADVTITAPVGDITIKGFRVVCEDGKQPWVGMPQSTYTKDGELVKRPVLEMSPRVKRQLAAAVLAEFDGLRANRSE